MADAAQARASINRWLGQTLPLDLAVSGDRIAYQMAQEAVGTEWRIYWDSERTSKLDQAHSRLVQIDRHRSDGDEVALELEVAAALVAMGLGRPGEVASVLLYADPNDPASVVGAASVRRSRGDGWRLLTDPANRPEHLRASLTLQIDYPG